MPSTELGIEGLSVKILSLVLSESEIIKWSNSDPDISDTKAKVLNTTSRCNHLVQ